MLFPYSLPNRLQKQSVYFKVKKHFLYYQVICSSLLRWKFLNQCLDFDLSCRGINIWKYKSSPLCHMILPEYVKWIFRNNFLFLSFGRTLSLKNIRGLKIIDWILLLQQIESTGITLIKAILLKVRSILRRINRLPSYIWTSRIQRF